MSVEKKEKLKENFLSTNISLSFSGEEKKTINECFREEIAKADRIEIAVAYCTYNSLKELDRLVEERNIKYICLILGMYRFIGFSEELYKLVIEINDKWTKKGIGGIRLTYSFKHHGKLYCFYRDDQIFSAILGSPNLSFLDEAQQRKPRQYEIALLTNNPSSLEDSREHLEKLKLENFTKNVAFLERYKSVITVSTTLAKERRTTKITYTKIP